MVHILGYSLGYLRGCKVLLGLLGVIQKVRSNSGPEVKIWGCEGRQHCGNEKAPAEGLPGH